MILVNKKNILSRLFFVTGVSLLILTGGIFTGFAGAQSNSSPGGISLEGPAGENPAPPTPPGQKYISDYDFEQLLKQADELLKYAKFDQTLALLNPYEVYVFGAMDHWSNMARFDWRLCQAYLMKSDGVNYVFYLRCITDESLQPKPTKHKSQYLAIVDDHGVETGKYYFGAALKSTDFVIRQAAADKIEYLKQSTKKIEAKTDPRMKYDNYPSSRARRTYGH